MKIPISHQTEEVRMPLFRMARESWEQLSEFRRKRNRCRDYTFGRQWNDIIEVDGRRITEYEYILSEGNVPLKNNLIRRIVRNVIGVFRERLPKIMESSYGDDLAVVAKENSLEEIFTRGMEEFLISGMAVNRKRIKASEGGIYGALSSGIITEMVSPGSFFFNTDSRDVRGRDINLVGQIHKVELREWCKSFVRNQKDYQRALQLFDGGNRKVNVTEVWRKEMVPRYILHDTEKGFIRRVSEAEGKSSRLRKSWHLQEVWKYYFLSDDGQVLCEGDSPFIHGGHPFVMKFYPFLDGEIQSFVGDMIDQQR